MKRLALLLAVVCLPTISVSAGFQADQPWNAPIPDEAKEHVRSAIKAWRDDKLDDALAEIKRALALAPHDLQSHRRYITITILRDGNDEKATAEYLARMEVEPRNPIYPFVLAQHYHFLNVPEDRDKLYEKVYAASPDSVWGQTALGLAHIERREWDKAVSVLRKVAEADPKDKVLRHPLTFALEQNGDYDEALSRYLEDLNATPEKDRMPWHYDGVWRVRLKQSKRAPEVLAEIERTVEKHLAEREKNRELLEAVAYVYGSVLRNQAKEEKLRKEAAKLPSPPRPPEAADAEPGLGITISFDEDRGFRRYVYSSTNAEVWEAVGDTFRPEIKDRIAALEALADKPMQGMTRIYYLEQLVEAYRSSERADLDLSRLETAVKSLVELDPQSASKFTVLAEKMLERKQGLDRALGYARQAFEPVREFKPVPKPRSPRGLDSIFTEAAQRERWTRRRASTLSLMGRIQVELGDFRTAEENLRASLSLQESVEARTALGTALDKSGRPSEASRQFAYIAVSVGGGVERQARKALDTISKRTKQNVGKLLAEAHGEFFDREIPELRKHFTDEPAKEFEAVALDKRTYKLSRMKDKVLFLNFWSVN